MSVDVQLFTTCIPTIRLVYKITTVPIFVCKIMKMCHRNLKSDVFKFFDKVDLSS